MDFFFVLGSFQLVKLFWRWFKTNMTRNEWISVWLLYVVWRIWLGFKGLHQLYVESGWRFWKALKSIQSWKGRLCFTSVTYYFCERRSTKHMNIIIIVYMEFVMGLVFGEYLDLVLKIYIRWLRRNLEGNKHSYDILGAGMLMEA